MFKNTRLIPAAKKPAAPTPAPLVVAPIPEKRPMSLNQLGEKDTHASVTTTERYTHLDLASPRRVAAVMADVLQGPAVEA